MKKSVNFGRGGYQGDVIEEAYKRFTTTSMPFWWQFREVLRASQEVSPNWKKVAGTPLSDDEQKQLIALSFLNYAVYTGIAEAMASLQQMKYSLGKTQPDGWRIFEVRRTWKATYSSLYSSLNALSNIVCVVIDNNSPFGDHPGKIWNYTPKKAIAVASRKKIRNIQAPLERCSKMLEIRDHLDHYWLIWVSIRQGRFLMDGDFEKGRVPLRQSEIKFSIDAEQLAISHLNKLVKDFNLIYRELSIDGGFLDQYLTAKGWIVDYTNYGPPHNGKRPKP